MEEYIKGLRNRLENSYRETDRLLVTISSGILAFSVALPKANLKVNANNHLLRWSWGVYLLTIITVLLSLLLEQDNKKKLIENNGNVDIKWNFSDSLLNWTNRIGVLLFIIATALFFFFINTNANI